MLHYEAKTGYNSANCCNASKNTTSRLCTHCI